jgi:hypothetical protein
VLNNKIKKKLKKNLKKLFELTCQTHNSGYKMNQLLNFAKDKTFTAHLAMKVKRFRFKNHKFFKKIHFKKQFLPLFQRVPTPQST